MRPSETRRRKPRWGQRRRHGCQGTRRRSASAGSANHPGYRHRLRRGAGRWNRGCHQGQWRHDVAGDEPTPAADRGPIHDIEQRRGDDDIMTAPSTTSPTTTTTAPPPTEAVDTSSHAQAIIPTTSVPSRTTCGPYPWPASGGILPPVDVRPGQADIAEGCSVSFTLRWSDGHAEARSDVLTSPGTYTLSRDRGTVWNFVVGTEARHP